MRKTIVRTATVSLAAAGLTFATLAPASAQVVKIHDGDGSGALNIRSAKISHTKKKVKASAKVTGLRKSHNQGVAFHVKTAPKKRYRVAVIVLRKKARVVLVKGNGQAVKCKKLNAGVNFKRDRAAVTIPRKCLGKPHKVRVRVETGKVGGKRADITRYSGWAKRG